MMTLGEIQTNSPRRRRRPSDSLSLLSHAVTPARHASAAVAGSGVAGGGGRQSVSQLLLTLQISINHGKTEQLVAIICVLTIRSAACELLVVDISSWAASDNTYDRCSCCSRCLVYTDLLPAVSIGNVETVLNVETTLKYI